MELLAHTRIVMWEGACLWVVDATPTGIRERQSTDLHAHHAIQVTLGLGGTFRLDAAGDHLRGEAAAVAADVPHVFAAEGLFALLFVEPESRMGRAITARLFGDAGLAAIPEQWLGDFPNRIVAAYRASIRDDATLADLGRGLVARMAADVIGEQPDPRVRKMILQAGEQLERGPVSLSDVAGLGGLSAGRLRHLFVEQTGLPFRTYILWLRLMRALEVVAAGASLTDAAHAAGFADSAHFSRTFRRMFGVAPAGLRMS